MLVFRLYGKTTQRLYWKLGSNRCGHSWIRCSPSNNYFYVSIIRMLAKAEIGLLKMKSCRPHLPWKRMKGCTDLSDNTFISVFPLATCTDSGSDNGAVVYHWNKTLLNTLEHLAMCINAPSRELQCQVWRANSSKSIQVFSSRTFCAAEPHRWSHINEAISVPDKCRSLLFL